MRIKGVTPKAKVVPVFYFILFWFNFLDIMITEFVFKYKKKYILVDALFLIYMPIHFLIFVPLNRYLEH